jgi:hypothetical protein
MSSESGCEIGGVGGVGGRAEMGEPAMIVWCPTWSLATGWQKDEGKDGGGHKMIS